MAFGTAISFLLCGESKSCKKSCPQGSLNDFWGKQKNSAGNFWFFFEKISIKLCFSLLYLSFLSILLVEKKKEVTVKKSNNSKLVKTWQYLDNAKQSNKICKSNNKKKSNPFFLNSIPIPSWCWIITFLQECLSEEEFSISFDGAVEQAVLTGQPACPAPVQGCVLCRSLLLWVKKAVKTTVRKLA